MHSNINFIVQFFIISKSIPWKNSNIELCVTSQEISFKFQKNHLRPRKNCTSNQSKILHQKPMGRRKPMAVRPFCSGYYAL